MAQKCFKRILCILPAGAFSAQLNIFINPLHPKISMPILHTALHTFPNVLTRRICLAIKSFFCWLFDHFLYSHDPNV